MEFLKIENLHVRIEDKCILKGINLTMQQGEIHVLMGSNGAGKSTLMNAVMGHPAYEITKGNIRFLGEDITNLSADKRAKLGIFLSFQMPEQVSGITVANFIRLSKIATSGKTIGMTAFLKELQEEMAHLNMDPTIAERYLNVGFSGGEKKKNEILQMLMLRPRLAMLDETDSGLDIDAVKTVSHGIQRFKTPENGVLIITHHREIVNNVIPDIVHVMVDGKIAATAGPELISEIENKGYEWFKGEM